VSKDNEFTTKDTKDTKKKARFVAPDRLELGHAILGALGVLGGSSFLATQWPKRPA
jgi:hypothetical protein